MMCASLHLDNSIIAQKPPSDEGGFLWAFMTILRESFPAAEWIGEAS